MALHDLAGKPAPLSLLTNIPRLVSQYYSVQPDSATVDERVSFGTSGHRGTSGAASFNEHHILAISQAVADYRKERGISGPLYLGMDTHALSEPAHASALEVLIANDVSVVMQAGLAYTPTPAISHAILSYNRAGHGDKADGIVITPSHNPPQDGGFKYNPPDGGPAGTEVTSVIQARANELLESNLKSVKRISLKRALAAAESYDFMTPYINDLASVIDLEAIRNAGLKLGVDPMGGAAIDYWEPIAERYGLDLTVVNKRVDPTFSFMTVDKDGKIRMDCSSPYAMASLIRLKEEFDLAFGNDPDVDRHGIVTKRAGLMNPNHYLSVAVWYLFQHRPQWSDSAAVGKTVVSSSMIDRVAKHLNRPLKEVPVGFKWFVDGLLDGSYGFGGEESAGASFLKKDGTVWTTDKDGIILNLLAAEIMAVTGKDPAEHYEHLLETFGKPFYSRSDAPANLEQKALLKALSPEDVRANELAGEPITAKLSRAPGNDGVIGGLKVMTENGWFAARPSGTEDIYKIYAESFKGEKHLAAIKDEAQTIVSDVFKSVGLG